MNESSIMECTTNPCLSSTCLSAPTAQCFPDYCDNCTSRYYYNDQEVTDTCCKLLHFIIISTLIMNTLLIIMIIKGAEPFNVLHCSTVLVTFAVV